MTPVYDFDAVISMRGSGSVKWETFPEDVLPMWVADTDFASPAPVTEALMARVQQGFFNYPRLSHSFRDAVCGWMGRYGWHPEPEWVLFQHAVIPGLIDAVYAFTAPGEKVLIQSPVYFPFHALIGRCGREKVVNSFVRDEGHWRIDFDRLAVQLADPAVRLMLISSPHNPLGRVYTVEELRRLVDLCQQSGVILVSDEIHCDIVYPPHRHVPTATVSPQASDLVITLLNPGKTFNLAGMRAAAALIPNAALRKRFSETVEARRSAEPTNLGPLALEVAYSQCGWYADQLVAYLQGNVRFMQEFLARELPILHMDTPEATYLMWLDCRGLKLSDAELSRFMLEEAKVALNAGIDFGPEGSGYMRMNIACPRSVLAEGLNRIKRAVSEHCKKKSL